MAQAMTMLQMGAAAEATKLLGAQRRRGGGVKVDVALAQALLQGDLTDASALEAEALEIVPGWHERARIYRPRA